MTRWLNDQVQWIRWRNMTHLDNNPTYPEIALGPTGEKEAAGLAGSLTIAGNSVVTCKYGVQQTGEGHIVLRCGRSIATKDGSQYRSFITSDKSIPPGGIGMCTQALSPIRVAATQSTKGDTTLGLAQLDTLMTARQGGYVPIGLIPQTIRNNSRINANATLLANPWWDVVMRAPMTRFIFNGDPDGVDPGSTFDADGLAFLTGRDSSSPAVGANGYGGGDIINIFNFTPGAENGTRGWARYEASSDRYVMTRLACI